MTPVHVLTKIDKTPKSCTRGATALMRVCIQQLVPLLEDNGEECVSSLVRKGLEVEIQQAMAVFRFF
jgi:hypothetical protein